MTASKKPISIVVAHCPNRGIGFNNDLPWPRLPKDMARFKKLSMDLTSAGAGEQGKAEQVRNAVLMGRKTWESIPEKYDYISC